jgi:8-oxo-dGTP pyrophosphatase MutT (NUDIX family)
MPDLYVFPGGRRDPGDNRVRLARPLRDEVFDKLMVRTQAQFRDPAARGLAVAAAREMMEEAHLSLTPADTQDPCARMSRSSAFSPARSRLRAMPRRFDTRFFACFTDEVDADPAVRDSERAARPDMASDRPIMKVSASAHYPGDSHRSRQALAQDPSLPFGKAVPFYYSRNGRFVRELI